MPTLSDPGKLLALSNALYIGAGALALASTLAIVYFGNKVTATKDRQLKLYQTQAEARIAEANRLADEAKEEAAKATERAEEARERAESTERQNHKLIARASAAEKKIEYMERPRRLTKEQSHKLRLVMSTEAPGVPFSVGIHEGDNEAHALAEDIYEVLSVSGWRSESGEVDQFIGARPELESLYLRVLVDDAEDSLARRATVRRLQTAFSEIGIDLKAKGFDITKMGSSEVVLFVGQKPPFNTLTQATTDG